MRRFVAGPRLENAIATCKRLAADGILSTLDHLGENVTTIEQADASLQAGLQALERLNREELAQAALSRAVLNELVSQVAVELQKDARFIVNGSGELAIDVDEIKLRECVQRKLAEASEVAREGVAT